jgi:cytochrome oxidase Cu insertion factor (SCO1/SenC/PrrC family)
MYLAVWLVALALVGGGLAGLALPRLLAKSPPASLGGGMVMQPNDVPAPAFTLRDQSGSTVALSDLRGKVIALTFLDTQCQNLCPLQASLLAVAQSDLGPRTSFSIIVVSVRPEADTPAAIDTFATSHGLKGGYLWLSGSRAQLSDVWNRYGITVQVANGDLEHSSVIYLIDRMGFERVGFLDVPEVAAFETDVRILDAG